MVEVEEGDVQHPSLLLLLICSVALGPRHVNYSNDAVTLMKM